MDGYQVRPEELADASHDIVGCVPQPQDVPLEDIPGDAQQYGHGGVYAALSRFCTTWQIATVLLARNAQGASGSLLQAAASYLREEASAAEDINRVGIGGAIGAAAGPVGTGGVGPGIGGAVAGGIGGAIGAAAGIGPSSDDVPLGSSIIADRLAGGSSEQGGI